MSCGRKRRVSPEAARRGEGERATTHLLVLQALDLALAQRFDEAILGAEVDDFGLGVAEVERVEEVVEARHAAGLGLRHEALGALALEVALQLARHGGREDEGAHVGASVDEAEVRARGDGRAEVVDEARVALGAASKG